MILKDYRVAKEKFNPIVLMGPSRLGFRDASEISDLLAQLSDSAIRIDDVVLNRILAQPNFRMVILKDPKTEEIIAVGSIYYGQTLMHPRGVGKIEDVVVDARYRGLGLGDFLIRFLIALARGWNLSKVELTSNSKRVAANELYIKHGFKKKDTNFYQLDLQKRP